MSKRGRPQGGGSKAHRLSTVMTLELSIDDKGVGITSRLSNEYLWKPGDVVRIIDTIAEHLAHRVFPTEPDREVLGPSPTTLADRISGRTLEEMTGSGGKGA